MGERVSPPKRQISLVNIFILRPDPGSRNTAASVNLPREIRPLSRNGKDFKITANQSTVRAGTEIRVKTKRPEVAISLTEMAKDSWVVFELPGFANADSGNWQGSVWPDGHADQHYGKPLSKTGPSPRTAIALLPHTLFTPLVTRTTQLKTPYRDGTTHVIFDLLVGKRAMSPL